MATREKGDRIEIKDEDLDGLLERLRQSASPEDVKLVAALVSTVRRLTRLLGAGRLTIRKLRELLLGFRTEKSEKVLGKEDDSSKDAGVSDGDDDPGAPGDPPGAGAAPPEDQETKKKRKGHGRNGAASYEGAIRIPVPHETLAIGNRCPECDRGNLYEIDSGIEPRFRGQPPLIVLLFERQKLRCSGCQAVFPAKLPEEAGTEKYDETTISMAVGLKYGMGMPFNRLEMLQLDFGLPLPASTQWELAATGAERCMPVYREIIRQAAQGELLHNDDTSNRIIDVTRADPSTRDKIVTTGIISVADGHEIALFATGLDTAGENLDKVLARRAAELDPAIQMCDALRRNVPKNFKTVLANCLAHGRRKFVDLVNVFPVESAHVIKTLRDVYHNDEIAKEQGLSPQERLEVHQRESGPLMEDLHKRMQRQFDEKIVEPNSALGKAIKYMLRHWEPLTLFLRAPGAPLDNNCVERALKMTIRHRKNSLFYKTRNGAAVGDLFMSIIHTCRLNKVNPFEYLTVIQKYRAQVAENVAAWMPWNYRDDLAAMGFG